MFCYKRYLYIFCLHGLSLCKQKIIVPRIFLIILIFNIKLRANFKPFKFLSCLPNLKLVIKTTYETCHYQMREQLNDTRVPHGLCEFVQSKRRKVNYTSATVWQNLAWLLSLILFKPHLWNIWISHCEKGIN